MAVNNTLHGDFKEDVSVVIPPGLPSPRPIKIFKIQKNSAMDTNKPAESGLRYYPPCCLIADS